MTSAHKWHVELVQGRYQQYNLSFEQAEKVYQFELDRDAPSDKHFFTQWELWDFELVTFKEILNEEQLTLYLSEHEREMREHEKFLIEQDNSEYQLKQLEYANGIIDFYKNDFIPSVRMNENIRMYMASVLFEMHKVTYLKEEFRKYLSTTKREILISSFRNNRTFKPNELKQTLLWHRINSIWPNYQQFYNNMDKPTQGVADFLYERLMLGFKDKNELLTLNINRKKHFLGDIFAKFYGDIGGWHVTIGELSPEEELRSFCMSVLLLDNTTAVK